MRIFEYKPNLGSFSLGFEIFSQNEVVEVVNLRKNAEFPYNKTHKQWFLPNFEQIRDYIPQKDFDLAIFNPDIGEKIGRKGKNNFYMTDLDDCLAFIKRERPKFVIFTLNIDAIPLLNTADTYVRDGYNEVSKDYIIHSLQKMCYDVFLVAIDEANYGIPTHKRIALYIATPIGFDMKFPRGLFTRFGSNKTARFRTIADAIGDLGTMGEWVPYVSQPQNVYQRHLRCDMDKVTWHFMLNRMTHKQSVTIKDIRQGSKASKTPTVKQNVGYIRPRWDRICPTLDEKFYLTSSRAPSIHPIANRTFTIREGMRIMGLPDTLSFDLKISKPEVAKMVVNSISPIIGEATAIALRCIE